MFEGLGFSFLEPSHHFLPPTAARRADTDCVRSHRKSTQRRARSDSGVLCVKMRRVSS